MQPKIISKGRLFITGLSGNGSKTYEVWADFDSRYNKTPFPKAEEAAYEVRFWESRFSGKIPDPKKSVHVGFLTASAADGSEFSTLELPAAEYTVFDVYVANGYDSGNEEMEKWLADNAGVYRMLEFDGFKYVIECYNEKFKDGDKPDSVVEIWIPVAKV